MFEQHAQLLERETRTAESEAIGTQKKIRIGLADPREANDSTRLLIRLQVVAKLTRNAQLAINRGAESTGLEPKNNLRRIFVLGTTRTETTMSQYDRAWRGPRVKVIYRGGHTTQEARPAARSGLGDGRNLWLRHVGVIFAKTF